MEKMCTVQMVKDNGYKADNDFNDKKCLTKEEFLGHFSKDNYEFSISDDRGLKQLFPYSDVN